MIRFLFCREQVKKQIIHNLREAGWTLLEPDVIELDTLDSKDLLTVLLESHNIRELANTGESISSYPIDMQSIGKN